MKKKKMAITPSKLAEMFNSSSSLDELRLKCAIKGLDDEDIKRAMNHDVFICKTLGDLSFSIDPDRIEHYAVERCRRAEELMQSDLCTKRIEETLAESTMSYVSDVIGEDCISAASKIKCIETAAKILDMYADKHLRKEAVQEQKASAA